MPGSSIGNANTVDEQTGSVADVAVGFSTAQASPAPTAAWDANLEVDIDYDEPRVRQDADRYSMNRVTRDLRRRKQSLEKALAEVNAGLDLLARDPHSLDAYRIIVEAY